jgi:hypothetical protein
MSITAKFWVLVNKPDAKRKLCVGFHAFVKVERGTKGFSPLSTETYFATLDFNIVGSAQKGLVAMRETSFLVVPFDADARGELQPGSPARLDTWEAAHFAASEVAGFHSGLAIIEEPDDDLGEPHIVEILGMVSPATVQIFGASSKAPNGGGLVDRMRNFMSRAVGGTVEEEPAQEFFASISQKRQALRRLPRTCQRPAH